MTEIEIKEAAQQLESKSAEAVIEWGAKRFLPRIKFAASFGAEDVVVIDLIHKVAPEITLFTLDTGRLPEETYAVIEAIREKYGVRIFSYFPKAEAVEALVQEKGMYSFRGSVENRKECCRIRKVEPLRRALADADAWITGLRRDQAMTRTELAKLELDSAHDNKVKLNPIADWSEEQVWAYIKQNRVPYNKLHDQNYPSIGCAPCTRAVQPGEDVRAGRWWWEKPEQKECGLHGESKPSE